jgi:hypothetical protein
VKRREFITGTWCRGRMANRDWRAAAGTGAAHRMDHYWQAPQDPQGREASRSGKEAQVET